jgi:rod shape-determining protein MreC
MNWISNLFSRYWRNVHLGTVVLLSILLIIGIPIINEHVSDAAVGIFYYPFFKVESSIVELVGVRDENRRLRQTLVESSMQISALEEQMRENERLRAVLGFDPPPGYDLVPAKVISVSSDKVPISALVNKGSQDSVRVNQAVINEDGLIGRIVEVMPDFSTVQLLTDPANRVAVRVTESRDMGIAKYGISEGMYLDNFPIQGRVEPGNTVISSGLGGIYPGGLKVGTVRSVKRPEDAPFCEVKLDPIANFYSLDELFVLRPQPR